MKIILILFILGFSSASDQIPGPKQNKPIMLKGAIIHTVSNGVIENGDIIIENGKIVSIGKFLTNQPYGTEIIDVSGKHIFPGLISSISTLGLQEIGAVRATRDYAETGKVNPNVRANVSYNTDSELIPISRSNGLLIALSAPRSGLISGMSSLMMLDGWTWEEATLKSPVGIHIFWPSMNKPKLNKNKKDTDKNKKLKQIQEIDNIFYDANAYLKQKNSSSKSYKHNLRLEALIPVINGEIPVFIHANEIRQIESAIFWADRQNIEMVLVGAKDSWMNTQLLVEKNVPVIYTQTHSTPMRRFERYDQSFITPKILYEAGVKFCISNSESPFETPHIRNLPYYAAKAGSYGLPWNIALRSITLSAAEILGVDGQIGSIDIGKDATLFISDGDILDIRTTVEKAFIRGREVDLNDRHKMLYSKYKKKYQQINILD